MRVIRGHERLAGSPQVRWSSVCARAMRGLEHRAILVANILMTIF